jgi:hypothetical protein
VHPVLDGLAFGDPVEPIRDPGTAGSALTTALPLSAPSATVRPSVAAQKLAIAWGSMASKLTPNTLLDMIAYPLIVV